MAGMEFYVTYPAGQSGIMGFKHSDMVNYRFYCEEIVSAEVMSILRKYNDVVIDNVDSNSFGITIESDNPEAFYQSLLDEIERDVFQYRVERDSIPNRTDLSR